MGQLAMDMPTPRKKRPKRGRGRPRKWKDGDAPKTRRRRFDKLTALHVTLKVTHDVKTLRRMDVYRAIRRATEKVLERSEFRIVHMSLERDHVHLVVEAHSWRALSRGMQAFEVSAARRINRVLRRRKGEVFLGRYFARVIKNPTQAHRVLNYVLNNWRKHGEYRTPSCASWQIDYYSSAPSFDGWQVPPDPHDDRDGPPHLGRAWRALPVHSPQHWFLYAGWRRVGAIRSDTVPSL